MGLDMYLTAEKYIGGYDFFPAEKAAYEAILPHTGLASIAGGLSPSVTVKVNVAYWRKANEIHAWFVDNVQNGVDECQESEVTAEQLAELRESCANALAAYRIGDKDDAASIMPTRAGFFFGGTEIDAYYANTLEGTIETIDAVLAHPDVKKLRFFYQSSW